MGMNEMKTKQKFENKKYEKIDKYEKNTVALYSGIPLPQASMDYQLYTMNNPIMPLQRSTPPLFKETPLPYGIYKPTIKLPGDIYSGNNW